MEPIEYLRALQRRWVSILLLTVLGLVGGLGYVMTVPSTYQASSSVFVTANQGDSASQALYQGNQYAQAVVQSYVGLATLPAVLDPVIDELGLDTTPQKLAGKVTATAALDTVIIDISASDTDPAQAQRIAQATADSLVKQGEALAPKLKGAPTVDMKVVAKAAVPLAPTGPNRPLYAALGAIAGLVLGLLIAIGRRLLDTRVSGEQDVTGVTGVPLLGGIGRFSNRLAPGPLMLAAPHGTVAEEYRRLRTNLEFANVDDPIKTVVVTSGHAGEGKSTTALNLALSIAEQGGTTLLVDGDLRRPSVANYTGLDGGVGLTNVLRNRVTIDSAVQPLGSTGLDVLPAGELVPNPSQLISSDALATLITTLKERYDYVVVDAPPVLLVSDALILAGLVDASIVVAMDRSTKRPDLMKTLEAFRLVHEPVTGVVLNRLPSAPKGAYYGQEAEEPSKPRKRQRAARATRAADGGAIADIR
jgi:capsular exopolysaccharide synthesis family protein